MESKLISFPTIGEVVREVFNVSGLLAQKDNKASILTNSEKKKIQSQLKRLADESSKIDGKLEELLALLKSLLFKVIEEERIVCMILEFVEELLVTYKNVLKSDGTYLNKKRNAKWFIKLYLLDRITTSFYKNFLRFNVPLSALNIPELTIWALPDINHAKVTWPLAHAWKLIYKSVSLSQSSFHYPDKKVDDFQACRNLENAQHWCATEQLPSINSLFSNLDYSLELLKTTQNKETRRQFSDKDINRFKILLFIGRAASYCFQNIYENYGEDFLVSCIKHVKGQSGRLSRINKKLLASINNEQRSLGKLSQARIDDLYYYQVSDYWDDYYFRSTQGGHILQEYLQDDSFHSFTYIEKAKVTIRCVGSITAYTMLTSEALTPNLKSIPTNFPELLLKGLQLKKNPNSISEIESYSSEIESAGLTGELEWLSSWCFANFFYRQHKFGKSYEHYKCAFDKAKYTAGQNQYLLVNQYIESCAKNKKFKEMKKAVAWANYLGIKVRWLRGFDDPESVESLKFLYSLMGNQKMQYAQV
jgi:hypothetical protein